jgi:hypothetical protein
VLSSVELPNMKTVTCPVLYAVPLVAVATECRILVRRKYPKGGGASLTFIKLALDVDWNVAALKERLEALEAKNVPSDELVVVPDTDRIAVGPTTS